MVATTRGVQDLDYEQFEADVGGAIERVERGETLQIVRDGKPLMRVRPLTEAERLEEERAQHAASVREIEEGFAALKKVPGLKHDQILAELHQERDPGLHAEAGVRGA